MNSSKQKYYAVARGHNPGIYTDWKTTNENVKGFSGAVYESFDTATEAQTFLDTYNAKNPPQALPPSLLDTLTDEQHIQSLHKSESVVT